MEDLSGDGVPDLIISTGARVWTFKHLGNGNFEAGQNIWSGLSGSVKPFRVLDWNDDGALDIVGSFRMGGIYPLPAYLPNLGDGTFGTLQTISNQEVLLSRLADGDNDGDLDLYYVTPDNEVYFQLQNAAGQFGTPIFLMPALDNSANLANTVISTLAQEIITKVNDPSDALVNPILQLSPNPVREVLNIQVVGLPVSSSENQLLLFDPFGRKVMEKSLPPTGRTELSVKNLPKGIYFLVFKYKENKTVSIVEKVLIQ